MNFVGSPVYLNVFGNLFKSLIQVWCQRVYLKYSNPRLHVKGLSIWDLRTMTMIPIIWITTWIIKRSMVTLLNSSGASFLPVHPVEILILVPPISYRTLCFRTLLLFISTKKLFPQFQKVSIFENRLENASEYWTTHKLLKLYTQMEIGSSLNPVFLTFSPFFEVCLSDSFVPLK